MNNIPTAEEFIKQYFDSKHPVLCSIRTATGLPIDEVKTFMTEFAKLHVKAALEAADKRAENEFAENAWENIVDKDFILNAYPENLIV